MRAKQLYMPLMSPGERWVRIKPGGGGHLVFKGGELFLVIEEQYDDWLLCWRDGRAPPCPVTGTLLREKYVEDVV